MPVYTYKCENCGIQFERQQSFSDQPLIRCPECSKKTLRKVYTPVGIVFKGSGFYATDHHSPSGQAPKSSASEEKKDGKSEPAAPTKPAASAAPESKKETNS